MIRAQQLEIWHSSKEKGVFRSVPECGAKLAERDGEREQVRTGGLAECDF